MMQISLCPFVEEDGAVLKSIRSGNLDLFNTLILKYQDQMFQISLRILGDEPSALDATQEAFLAAYTKLNQFRGGSFKAWLIRIVVNKSYDQIRSCSTHFLSSLEGLSPDWNELFAQSLLPVNDPSPAAQVENRDLEMTIQNCLDKLPFHLRTVLVLVDVEELSYVEASRALNIPIGTVKSRLARGRLKMQALLQSSGASIS